MQPEFVNEFIMIWSRGRLGREAGGKIINDLEPGSAGEGGRRKNLMLEQQHQQQQGYTSLFTIIIIP